MAKNPRHQDKSVKQQDVGVTELLHSRSLSISAIGLKDRSREADLRLCRSVAYR